MNTVTKKLRIANTSDDTTGERTERIENSHRKSPRRVEVERGYKRSIRERRVRRVPGIVDGVPMQSVDETPSVDC